MRERARGRWGSRRGGSRDAVSLAALGTRRERGVGNREARVRSDLGWALGLGRLGRPGGEENGQRPGGLAEA